MFWVAYTIQAAGAFLALWGLTLFLRAAMHRRRLRHRKNTGPAPDTSHAPVSRLRRHIGFPRLIGAVAAVLGVGAWLIGVVAHRWLRGEGFDISTSELSAMIAGAMIVTAVALSTVGWKFHSARGGRRCPKCFYDCASLPSPMCPECGFTRPDWKLFEKDVREPKLLIAAAILIVLTPLAYRAPIAWKSKRLLDLVPTTLLIAGWEYWPEEVILKDANVNGGLAYRMNGWEERPWSWQSLWLDRSTAAVRSRSVDFALLSRANELRHQLDLDATPLNADAIVAALKGLSSPDSDVRTMCETLIIEESMRVMNARAGRPIWIPSAVDHFLRDRDATLEMLSGDAGELLRSGGGMPMVFGVVAAFDDECLAILNDAFDRSHRGPMALRSAAAVAVRTRPELQGWLADRINRTSGIARAAAIAAYLDARVDTSLEERACEWMHDADAYVAVSAMFYLSRGPSEAWMIDLAIERFISDPLANAPMLSIMHELESVSPRLLAAAQQFLEDPSHDELLRSRACRVIRSSGAESEEYLTMLDYFATDDQSELVRNSAGRAAKLIRQTQTGVAPTRQLQN